MVILTKPKLNLKYLSEQKKTKKIIIYILQQKKKKSHNIFCDPIFFLY